MDLSNLARPEGANSNRKRVGRGQGSTWGKTCGKGQKGQKSRAGGNIPARFEGGQMPLQMRIPKSGFTNPNRTDVVSVNLSELERVFEDGAVVTIASLADAGVIKARVGGVLGAVGAAQALDEREGVAHAHDLACGQREPRQRAHLKMVSDHGTPRHAADRAARRRARARPTRSR